MTNFYLSKYVKNLFTHLLFLGCLLASGSSFADRLPGVLCEKLPGEDGMTITGWLTAQENNGGHTQERHINKDEKYLQNRNIAIASTWLNEETMWKYIAKDVQAFCENAIKRGNEAVSSNIALSGESKEAVGEYYIKNSEGKKSIQGNERATIVYKNGFSGWYLLTTYPQPVGR
ncbi:RNase A-like domain-containing protein [Leminorella grimontii]|uniref:RNase A-like domain-containing protein n=1 Tax=Leminorella grimontii TaxID=82981 RepID=UPI0032200CB1